MIAKGVPHPHGARLARYLITGKDGECAQLLELRGFAATGIIDAFRSVHVVANGSKCSFPFFHVSVRNPDGETLEAVQWAYTADAIERSLGLDNQPRAIAFHTCDETGESHMHVAWSRMDHESLTAKPLPFWKERLKRVCRGLEKHFGLTEVSSARNGPITYAPTRSEEEQSRRLGIDLRDLRETIRECFERSDCGLSFQKALAAQQILLARGDRRDFLAVDRAGGIHALGKRVLGISATEIRVRLSDLPLDQMPTVEEARQALRGEHVPPIIEAKPLPPRPPHPSLEEEGTQLVSTIKEVPAPPFEESVPDFVNRIAPGEETEPPIPRSVEAPLSAAKTATGSKNSDGIVAVLKRQFRATVKAIFKRTSSPLPQPRRRKSGETVSTFRLAARRLLKPIVRLPVITYAAGFLHDTFPWLHLWEWNDTAGNDLGAGTFDTDDNHPSPHP